MDWSTLYFEGKVMLFRKSAKHKFPNRGNRVGFSLPKTNVDFFFFIKSNLNHLVQSWYK